jgi:hypothetical protein
MRATYEGQYPDATVTVVVRGDGSEVEVCVSGSTSRRLVEKRFLQGNGTNEDEDTDDSTIDVEMTFPGDKSTNSSQRASEVEAYTKGNFVADLINSNPSLANLTVNVTDVQTHVIPNPASGGGGQNDEPTVDRTLAFALGGVVAFLLLAFIATILVIINRGRRRSPGQPQQWE